MKGIIAYIEKNTWFQLDGDIEDFEGESDLIFTTRENGNVGDEMFGEKDWNEAERIMLEIIREFGHLIKSQTITTCDEWVNLEIELKDEV